MAALTANRLTFPNNETPSPAQCRAMDDQNPTALTTTHLLPAMLRAAQIEPATFNESARTVDVVFTTGAKVRRYDWLRERYYDEELIVSGT
jgi:hypothetical protein